MDHSTIITSTYDYRLVALSVVIAICASYAALDLAGRITAARNSQRMAWLVGGAIAMGAGIWSMHYTGMLAYHLSVPVYYHIPTVALSLVAAICASFVALFVVSRPRMDVFHVVAGSSLMAAGICGMHYIGMDAMRLPAMHHWDMTFVVLSVVIALVVALAALGLTFLFREEGHDKVLKAICAIIMGFAIPAMHYTAMAAVNYTFMPDTPDLTNAVDISMFANVAIIVVTFVILGSVFLIPRWFAPQSAVQSEA
ncbi:MAG TPA: MHYT domain-containing protein [Candidatus Angelobacter sp.]|nr:MHYT domain-containing protein [Candidatus Angelobacter sp.]